MGSTGISDEMVRAGADLIEEGFASYHEEFKHITMRARGRFEECDWHGLHSDAEERLDLHGDYVAKLVAELEALLGNRCGDKELLGAVKREFTQFISKRDDFDVAQSFFNSVMIRVARFGGIAGIDTSIEFMGDEFATPAANEEH